MSKPHKGSQSLSQSLSQTGTRVHKQGIDGFRCVWSDTNEDGGGGRLHTRGRCLSAPSEIDDVLGWGGGEGGVVKKQGIVVACDEMYLLERYFWSSSCGAASIGGCSLFVPLFHRTVKNRVYIFYVFVFSKKIKKIATCSWWWWWCGV